MGIVISRERKCFNFIIYYVYSSTCFVMKNRKILTIKTCWVLVSVNIKTEMEILKIPYFHEEKVKN